MSLLDTAMRRLQQMIRDDVERRAPFRAIVTSIDGTTGMVTIRRLGATTAEAELRARVGVGVLDVDDEVLCLPVSGKPVVIGKVYRTGPPNGGTVIVTFGAIQGDPGDNAALAAALDEKVNEEDVTEKNGLVDDVLFDATDVTNNSIVYGIANILGVLTRRLQVSVPWLHGQLNQRILAGTNVSKTYDDEAGTITLSASGGSGSVDWGDIHGDLEDQEDLQSALDAKADTSDLHNHANKTVLDAITAAFTTAQASQLGVLVDLAVLEHYTDASGWAFVVDEDDMASNSDTKLPTQQSVKAYVDANAGDGHTHANKATLDLIEEAFLSIHLSTLQGLVNHANNTSNPHSVTKAQVELGNVPNVDARARSTHTGTQAISTVTGLQTALNAKKDANHFGSTALATAVSTTSTSNQTVTALNISAAANATYQITYVVQLGCDGAGGLRLGVNAPSGSDVSYITHGSVGAASGADWTGELSTGAGPGIKGWGQNAVVGGSIPTGAATITAIVHTGGSSGNISLQYRANTSGQTSIIGTGTKVSWVRTG